MVEESLEAAPTRSGPCSRCRRSPRSTSSTWASRARSRPSPRSRRCRCGRTAATSCSGLRSSNTCRSRARSSRTCSPGSPARDGRMLAYRHRGFWQPADTIKGTHGDGGRLPQRPPPVDALGAAARLADGLVRRPVVGDLVVPTARHLGDGVDGARPRHAETRGPSCTNPATRSGHVLGEQPLPDVHHGCELDGESAEITARGAGRFPVGPRRADGRSVLRTRRTDPDPPRVPHCHPAPDRAPPFATRSCRFCLASASAGA